jgi:hypothetical protein
MHTRGEREREREREEAGRWRWVLCEEGPRGGAGHLAGCSRGLPPRQPVRHGVLRANVARADPLRRQGDSVRGHRRGRGAHKTFQHQAEVPEGPLRPRMRRSSGICSRHTRSRHGSWRRSCGPRTPSSTPPSAPSLRDS